ncbi:MAG TPA: hypothetical protein VK600_00165 [Candidatus Saccharimonadales bacterium]|nr:hypothetical protein [Candidatus Saccharimonadales bacterium]
MDGYSVTEAASVLGVPEGRVWELLARGVLSGTPEGDSMRVFLKTQPGPIAPSSAEVPRRERPRTNGNGGAHDGGEASAFRELLTEFRNLTERYGQALLALGEARGEVAGLRSRVDLLEARLDLRLPGPATEAAVPWSPASTEAAQPAQRPVVPSPPAPPEDRGPAPRASAKRAPTKRARGKSARAKRATVREALGGATIRPRPGRARRQAVSSIAAALARAEDPTISELTGGREAAEALAALQAEAIAPTELVDEMQVEEQAEDQAPVAAAEPHTEAEPAVEPELVVEAEPEPAMEAQPAVEPELVVEAEPEPVMEAQAEAEPATAEPALAMEPMTIEPEPDWFADGDFAWLDAAEKERSATPATEAETVIGESLEAPEVEEPAPSLQVEEAAAQVAVAMAIPEVGAELIGEPPEQPDSQPVDEGIDQTDERPEDEAEDEAEDEPGDQGDDRTDDEPGWGASPAAAAAEAEEEIQAAFDEMPEAVADDAPTATESDIQAAFDEGPPASEPSTSSTLSRAEEVEVAVIDMAIPPMAEPRVDPGPPLGAVFSPTDLGDPGETEENVEVDTTEDAAASELESASSWRPQSRDTWRPTAPATGLQLTDEELAQLAADEGWDTSEVDAIRTLIGRGAPQPEARDELPGSGDLRDAMAALDAIPIRTNSTSTVNEPDEEWWRQPARPMFDAGGPDTAHQAAPSAPGRGFGSLGPEPDPEWLRRRRGPAANAYRRIRRLFTG